MITLDDFSSTEQSRIDKPEPDIKDSAREESVPLNPLVPMIRNWPLVVMMIQEAFAQRPERTALLLDSNGSTDKPATQWRLRRVIS